MVGLVELVELLLLPQKRIRKYYFLWQLLKNLFFRDHTCDKIVFYCVGAEALPYY